MSEDSDSESEDWRFSSPQAMTPRNPSPPPAPVTTISSLKPPSFSLSPEDLPPEHPPPTDLSSDSSVVSSALDSLSKILTFPLPSSALYDSSTTSSVSRLLRAPNSGSGDNPLCRWLYDTFLSNDPALHLLVLRFVPLVTGVYLARASTQRRHLAGFEAVLLALYSSSRTSHPLTIPDLASTPTLYHQPDDTSTASDPVVQLSPPPLEPQGTVMATRRACIVGVALHLYYRNICLMPIASKLEFCEFCDVWAGHVVDQHLDGAEERIPLPWELLQPTFKILGHCLFGHDAHLRGRARTTCRKLHARALHDLNPNAILATQSLLRMLNIQEEEEDDEFDKDTDYTELPDTRLISI